VPCTSMDVPVDVKAFRPPTLAATSVLTNTCKQHNHTCTSQQGIDVKAEPLWLWHSWVWQSYGEHCIVKWLACVHKQNMRTCRLVKQEPSLTSRNANAPPPASRPVLTHPPIRTSRSTWQSHEGIVSVSCVLLRRVSEASNRDTMQVQDGK